MKIKINKKKVGLLETKSFTGIIETCDGMDSVFNVEIAYYKNGDLHRENGPAIDYADGSKSWYLNDKFYSETEWKIEVEKLRKSRLITAK
jgi:hypothetical protein